MPPLQSAPLCRQPGRHKGYFNNFHNVWDRRVAVNTDYRVSASSASHHTRANYNRLCDFVIRFVDHREHRLRSKRKLNIAIQKLVGFRSVLCAICSCSLVTICNRRVRSRHAVCCSCHAQGGRERQSQLPFRLAHRLPFVHHEDAGDTPLGHL